jgi:hypothetical protein
MKNFDPENNLRSPDRILVLEPIANAPKTDQGLVDKRLFSGENKLHCRMNLANNMWSFNYDSGILPSSMRGNFTSFKKAREYAESYFLRRGIKVKEVID